MSERMRPEIDFAGRAMQGHREDQEDYHAFQELADGRVLFVVADGAGGQASGELASSNAAQGFLDYFSTSQDTTAPSLFAALQEGNRRLAAFMEGGRPQRDTMATTLLAVVVDDRALNWISVGDSPLLLYREYGITRLNADHSLAAHPGASVHTKNILRSALVGGRIPMIDWRRTAYELQEDDIILAASDGLWTLSPAEIAGHIATHTTETAAEIANGLLHFIEAKGRPHQDNVTVGIIKVAG